MATTWKELSWDPNAPSVIAWQQTQLAASAEPAVAHRLTYLRSLARNKRVLDIGVVEHGASNETTEMWLHRHLADVAASILGVDILDTEVAKLAERGWNVITHDVCAAPLPDTEFDLIVMGEVIEHLSEPGAMLRNLPPMLASGGRVVITTPNPYMIHRAFGYVRGRFPDSVDHVSLLGPANMAELGRRNGLDLVTWRGVRLKRLKGARNGVIDAARRLLVAVTRNELLACDTVMYEFVSHDQK